MKGKNSRNFDVAWIQIIRGDSDVWMNQEFKPNTDPYYKYILCYVDKFLHIYFKPKEYMYELNMIYRLK